MAAFPTAVLAESPLQRVAAALIAAYPSAIARLDGGDLIFKDGRRLPISDGNDAKSPAARLENASILDMFADPYPLSTSSSTAKADADPGRARNIALFDTLYGDCKKGETQRDLVDVVWLPDKSGVKVKMTRRNGAADRLAAVSRELNALPARFTTYLVPLGGTFNCRVIAGTSRASTHGYGIAIDIALRHARYWRWGPTGKSDPAAYRNAIPQEIVLIFEKHGFIWGGRWAHFDTMHFEYRPEIIAFTRAK